MENIGGNQANEEESNRSRFPSNEPGANADGS